MSKSLKRVVRALADLNLDCEIMEVPGETRTASQAAKAAGCRIDQIAKSIIFAGTQTGQIVLFVTAGGNQVDPDKAAVLVGEPLGRADANAVRRVTGFAIGGVSPVGHLSPIPCFLDPRLLEFTEIWAAAGTPRHIFRASPHDLGQKIQSQTTDFIV